MSTVPFAGFGYLVGFTLVTNYMAYLALKYYSGQQDRASVSLIWQEAAAAGLAIGAQGSFPGGTTRDGNGRVALGTTEMFAASRCSTDRTLLA